MNDFLEGIKKASEMTAISMTGRLRKTAYENGWDPSITRNMQVDFDEEEGFGVSFASEVADSAMNMEYGTEEIRPTAAIRKYNNSKHAEQAFMTHLKKNTRGLV